jgi:oligoribonuclease (3'-5' exoribonuclease)
MLDVSSWKLVFQNLYKKKYEKTNQHRAMGDIAESISELRYYLSFIKMT